MQDTITLRGFVATDPVTRHTAGGAPVAAFRLATTERRFDRDAGAWVDAHTNWYSVSAFGQLGANTAQSVRKGNPVIVTGRLRVRDWSSEERSGTSVDIQAEAVGLDLGYGSVAFLRSQRSSAVRPSSDGDERADASQDAADFGGELPAPLRGGDAPAGDHSAETDGEPRPEHEQEDAAAHGRQPVPA